MDSNCELRIGEDQYYLRDKYDCVDGYLFKKRKDKSGLQIGTTDRYGYVRTKIKGGSYSVHRLIWIWHYGSTEGKFIDHINGVKDDNRIENLRLATNMENQHNRKVNKNSTSGIKGVYSKRGKYVAQITVNSRRVHLGYYKTAKEAGAAYQGAAFLYQGDFRYREKK